MSPSVRDRRFVVGPAQKKRLFLAIERHSPVLVFGPFSLRIRKKMAVFVHCVTENLEKNVITSCRYSFDIREPILKHS